jgi:hypothetical protein
MSKKSRLYIGLLHYPVYNKNKEVIASAITTFDLHDLSRLGRTFGVVKFYVVTPLHDQQVLAERVLYHWTVGYGAEYNKDRKEAFGLVHVIPSLDEAVRDITNRESEPPLIIATDASRDGKAAITYERARELTAFERPVLIMFGTAWGLERSVLRRADYLLEPIEGPSDYNHLSVRTAAAIILDRLMGESRPL